ncbi:hypothetical protein MMC11_000993 [Xylographa trunciseda]|nr:hypothetical protein [Xylographa trunciseda]
MATPTLDGLPLELKRLVLGFTLIAEKPIYIKPPLLEHSLSATFPGEKSGVHPAILTVSKTYTTEGLDIMYSKNIFHFKTIRTFCAFISSIVQFSRHLSFNNLARVEHICLDVSSELLECLLLSDFVGVFSNLKVVDLNSWYYDKGESPMKDSSARYILRRIKEEMPYTFNAIVNVVEIDD